MPLGTCRLCLTPTVELRDSHFVPRSFYKMFHERGLPVTASAEVSMISGQQASAYLLCDGCEQKFNLGGEKWIRANCWQDPNRFPLRSALLASGPSRYSSGDLTMFETAGLPDVDREKLVYFGTSVIWRGAVHKWHMPSGDPVPICLGRYEDDFRRYLLGEAGFPQSAVMLVSVAASMDEMKNKSFTFPWLFKRENGHHQLKVVAPGITYQLFVGNVLPPAPRKMCTLRSKAGFVYMSKRTDDVNLQGNLEMLKTSKRVGKLAKSQDGILSDGVTTR